MSAQSLARGVSLVALAFFGCADPTVNATVDELGPEAPGVGPGPNHRPGQPCVACHQNTGRASPFSLAGTVYQDRERTRPLVGARLDFIDAKGHSYATYSNCVGNFYIGADEWHAHFPLWVQLVYGNEAIFMQTPIQRERSCATCHFDPSGPDSAGHVYLSEEALSPSPGGCR